MSMKGIGSMMALATLAMGSMDSLGGIPPYGSGGRHKHRDDWDEKRRAKEKALEKRRAKKKFAKKWKKK